MLDKVLRELKVEDLELAKSLLSIAQEIEHRFDLSREPEAIVDRVIQEIKDQIKCK